MLGMGVLPGGRDGKAVDHLLQVAHDPHEIEHHPGRHGRGALDLALASEGHDALARLGLGHELAVESACEIAYRGVTRCDPGCAGVDGDARDLDRVDPSAEAVTALDDDDLVPGSRELVRCREPCEPGADDNDVDGSGADTGHGHAPFVCGLTAVHLSLSPILY
nr:hypothetical protein [Streptomyces sp. CS227]